jgi:calcineurin-like phosphoesterase family protein
VRKLVFALSLSLAAVALPVQAEGRRADASRASLTLRPGRVEPGAIVRVRGRGFPARARVTLFFNRKRVRRKRAGPTGGFRARLRAPRGRPRLVRLTARGGGVVVKLRFRVTGKRRRSPAKPPASAPAATAAAPAPPPPPAPPKLVAVGDIACHAPFTVAAAACHHEGVAGRVQALHPDVIATLGDAQYQNGTLQEYLDSFDKSWGVFKPEIRPVAGNHEYLADGSAHTTASGHFGYFGTAAGDAAKGYYAYSIGSWHAFVLNSGDFGYGGSPDCFPVGCQAGSTQETWLRSELEALPPGDCAIAYFHHPRYTSDTPREQPGLRDLYDAIYDNGVELLLVGHSHLYERMTPMDGDGNADPQTGVREFVVGTGGRSRFTVSTQRTGSEKLDTTHFGALELKLAPGGYDFRFVAEDGSVQDQGSGSCHGAHA